MIKWKCNKCSQTSDKELLEHGVFQGNPVKGFKIVKYKGKMRKKETK